MKDKERGVCENCGCELGRPYVNNQIFTKIYNLSKALERGTIFPELDLIESNMYNPDLYKAPKKRSGGKK